MALGLLFVLTSLASFLAVPQPTRAATLEECEGKTDGIEYLQCIGASRDDTTTDLDKLVKRVLDGIGSRNELQKAFFNEVKEDDPGSLDLNVRTFKSGFARRPNADISDKYEGNPFIWLKKEHAVHLYEGDDKVATIETGDVDHVRFVLTDVEFSHAGDADAFITMKTKADSNTYIFRNEYNPSIAIALRARDFNAGQSAQDEAHLVYNRDCKGTFDKDAWAADINGAGAGHFDGLTGADDKEAVEKIAKKYNLNQCDTDKGTFAGVMAKAMKAMKDGIEAFFNWIRDALLNLINIGTLTDNKGLVKAWETLRTFVNYIFILILVVIAFSNMLRIDTERYGVRALLPRLVFAVIAVNFSFLLVQILLNVSYIISQPFISKAFSLLSNPPADGSIIDPSSGIGQFLITLVLVFAVLIGFIFLFIFFVARIIVIWMLAALSPFVFLFMVLPLTRSLASMWWKNAIKWIFMAPIAFIILYVAAELLATPTGKDTDVNGPDFLLKVAFFAGAAFAAVMIPLKLGGEVMGRALGAARGGAGLGGKFGGKAGLMAADRIKVPGGGPNLGTRIRSAAIASGRMKPPPAGSRGSFKYAQGMDHLQNQISENKGVGRLAGASEGQRLTAFDGAVQHARKEMSSLSPMAQTRVAHAAAFGTATGADGKLYAKNDKLIMDGATDAQGNLLQGHGENWGAMDKAEQEYSKDRVHSSAAYQALAESDQASSELTSAPQIGGWSFAQTGYQQRSAGNPLVAAIDRDKKGTFRQSRANFLTQKMSNADFQKLDDEFLGAIANPAHSQHDQAVEAANAAGAVKWGNAVDASHRMKMHDPRKRQMAYRAALNSKANKYNTLNKEISDKIIHDYEQGLKDETP